MGSINEEVFDALIYWIVERQDILFAKKRGVEAPWSSNKVMQQTYFCNVRREEDKVTAGIRRLWNNRQEPCQAAPNMIMARMVNKVESLEAMGWPWAEFNLDRWTEVMSQKGSWGGAYIVSTNGRSMPKHEYIGELLSGVWEAFKAITLPNTLGQAHKRLIAIQGLGSFMAAQVVADLKNTPDHTLQTAEDWSSWCAHGPGSLRGMAWLLKQEKCTPTRFYAEMPNLRELVDERLEHPYGDFCNQDLQNCLCEFDKFMRVTNNTGRSKRKYNGGGS